MVTTDQQAAAVTLTPEEAAAEKARIMADIESYNKTIKIHEDEIQNLQKELAAKKEFYKPYLKDRQSVDYRGALSEIGRIEQSTARVTHEQQAFIGEARAKQERLKEQLSYVEQGKMPPKYGSPATETEIRQYARERFGAGANTRDGIDADRTNKLLSIRRQRPEFSLDEIIQVFEREGGQSTSPLSSDKNALGYNPKTGKIDELKAPDYSGIEGNIITNVLHGGEKATGYRSPTTGKYYPSQEEAYRQGAAPKPPVNYLYTLGLSETLGVGQAPVNPFIGKQKVSLVESLQLSERIPSIPERTARIQYQQQIKQFIVDAKQAGVSELLIESNGVTKIVPIGRARTELIKALREDPNATIKKPGIIALEENILIGERAVNPPTPEVLGPPKPQPGAGVKDFIEGLAVPIVNLGKLFGSFPEGIKREIQSGSLVKAKEKGEEFLAEQGLKPTLFGSLISGQPTGRSKEYELGTALTEIGLAVAPLGLGKIPKIKTPLVKSITPTKEKFAPTIKTGIKAYPQSKLRSQGFEERPEIKQTFTPPEEIAIRKSFVIPETNIKEITTKGARLAERPKDILTGIPKETAKPITVEVKPMFKETKIPLGKAVGEYERPQIYGPFEKPKAIPVKEVEGFTPEKPRADVFRDDYFKSEQVELGAGTARPPPMRFVSEPIPLGKSTGIITSKSLGRGAVKIIKGETERPRFLSEKIQLDKSTHTITRIPLGSGTNLSSKEQIYGPFEKPKAIPVKEVEGFTPEKPRADVFRDDYFKSEQVELGAGTGKLEKTLFTPSEKIALDKIKLGEGEVSFISRGGVRSTTPFRKFRPDEGVRRGRYVTLLEPKIKENRFVVTTIPLGKAKGDIIKTGTVTAGGVGPTPLLKNAIAETEGSFNETGTNVTTPQTLQQNETQVTISSPSSQEQQLVQQSQVEQQQRAKQAVAAQKLFQPQNILTRLDSRLAQPEIIKNITKEKPEIISIIRTDVSTRQRQPQKEKERQIFRIGTPQPFVQPPKLAQPEKFAFRQRQRLQEPPKPPTRLFGRFAPDKNKEKKTTKKGKVHPDDFVGNVSDVEVGLGFNRGEITTGIKRSEKRYQKDIKFAYKQKGAQKFTTQKTGSILSKRQRSILEREKSKEVKRQKKRTGGFF